MKCPFCGTEIADSAKFCYSCGANVQTAAEAADSVRDALNEMGDAAGSYVEQLGDTAQQYADALQNANAANVTDDDYLEALKKAEETVQNGYEPAYSGGFTAPAAAGDFTSPYTTPDSGSYTAPEAGTYAAPDAGSYTAPSGGEYSAPAYTPTSNYTAKQNGQRARNLLAALWHSGKLVKVAIFAVMAIVFFIIFALPGGSKGGKVHDGGYDDYKELISDYVTTMQKENYSSAIKAHTPQVIQYFKDNDVTDPADFLKLMDEACEDGIYGNIESWSLGTEVDWDPAEYYAEDFQELGINSSVGKDVNVNFKFKNGAADDYYVFEMIQMAGKWYLISVYY